MATDTLTAVPANSEPSLYELATNIQIQAGRISSLAEAIDEALDFGCQDLALRAAFSRAGDYVNLIIEAAERARASGEAAEIHAMRHDKAARS